MKPRCKGCAFTEGTEANKDVLTQAKAMLCVSSYEPFYCHENAVNDKLPKGREHLCRGWAEAVAGKDYPPDWKRRISAQLLGVITKAEDGEIPDDDQAIQAAVIQAIMESQ